MSEAEWLGLEDFPSTADESWYEQAHYGAAPADSQMPLKIVDFTSFVTTQEPSAEPLLGTETETLLPADGMLLMYGDGGAGKTTLTIDAVSHLAAGEGWLSVDVQRPVKTLLIENEGPRGKFRQMLAEKHASWNGHPAFHPNVTVLEEPWTRFTMREPAHRQGLAEHITESEVDLLVMGPLVTLGMVGGGTPDEISEFEGLLREFKSLLERPVALWIVHHENKQGDVSGAWERVPDTLVHVQAQGNGRTRLHWRKARWSSEKHGTSVELIWVEGRSFQLEEKPERDPWAEMLRAFKIADEWRTVKESAKLISISEADAKKVLASLVRRGEMRYEVGPSGRHHTAHCYRLSGALTDLAHLSAPGLETLAEEEVRWCAPPVRGAAPLSAPTGEGAGALSAPSAPDEEIPF